MHMMNEDSNSPHIKGPHEQLKILEEIGSGASGVVFKVASEKYTEAALKVIPVHEKKEQPDKRNANREINFHELHRAAQCKGKFIIKCYELWNKETTAKEYLSWRTRVRECLQTEQLDFPSHMLKLNKQAGISVLMILMEYCEIGNLDMWLRRTSQDFEATFHERMQLYRNIVEGVQFLHARNLIHRDISPANVLLSRDKGQLVPKISDFGTITSFGGNVGWKLTKTKEYLSRYIGTPVYAAPELQGNIYDKRVDDYSLGVLAIRMFCNPKCYDLTDSTNLAYLVNRLQDGTELVNIESMFPSPVWFDFVRDQVSIKQEERLSCDNILASRILDLSYANNSTRHVHHNGGDIKIDVMDLVQNNSIDETSSVSLSTEWDGTGHKCQHVLALPPSNANNSVQQVPKGEDARIDVMNPLQNKIEQERKDVGETYYAITLATTSKIREKFKIKLQDTLERSYEPFSSYLITKGCLQDADLSNVAKESEIDTDLTTTWLQILLAKEDGLPHLLSFLKENESTALANEICTFAVGFMKICGASAKEISIFLGLETQFDVADVHALFSGPLWLSNPRKINMFCEKFKQALPTKLYLWLCLLAQAIAVIGWIFLLVLFGVNSYYQVHVFDDCELYCVFERLEKAATACGLLFTFAGITMLGRDFAILDFSFDRIFASYSIMDNGIFFSITSKSVLFNVTLSLSIVLCIYVRACLRRFLMITVNISTIDSFLNVGYSIGLLLGLYCILSVIVYIRLHLKLQLRVNDYVYQGGSVLCSTYACLLCVFLGISWVLATGFGGIVGFAFSGFDYNKLTWGIVLAYVICCAIIILLWSMHPRRSIILILALYVYFLILLQSLIWCPGFVAEGTSNTTSDICYIETLVPYYCVNGCGFDKMSPNQIIDSSTCSRC